MTRALTSVARFSFTWPACWLWGPSSPWRRAATRSRARPARRHELAARRTRSPAIGVAEVGGVAARARSRPVGLEWLVLAPGDDLERVIRRRNPPDVLLGGRAPSFERLAREERLMPVRGLGIRFAGVARRRTRTTASTGARRSPYGSDFAGVGDDGARAGSMAGGLCPAGPGRRA